MIKILHRMEWFLGLVLLQVLVLNQMHVAEYATPFFYIYFILKFNSRVGRNELMLWSFALGLTVDMFGNTPGMNAAAATCLAFTRNSLMRLVTLRDLDEGFRPSIKNLGFSSFFLYSLFSISPTAFSPSYPMILVFIILPLTSSPRCWSSASASFDFSSCS